MRKSPGCHAMADPLYCGLGGRHAGAQEPHHEPRAKAFRFLHSRARINLYSDTQSKPTPGMKEAMLNAEVGDEQGGSDPSVWTLCDRVAALLGKEAAVFLPSGTMCNQVAIATHCRPGDEILAHEDAHIQSSEAGGAGAITSGDADQGAVRRPRHVLGRRSRGSDHVNIALFPAAKTDRGRADRQQGRRHLLVGRRLALGRQRGASARHGGAH